MPVSGFLPFYRDCIAQLWSKLLRASLVGVYRTLIKLEGGGGADCAYTYSSKVYRGNIPEEQTECMWSAQLGIWGLLPQKNDCWSKSTTYSSMFALSDPTMLSKYVEIYYSFSPLHLVCSSSPFSPPSYTFIYTTVHLIRRCQWVSELCTMGLDLHGSGLSTVSLLLLYIHVSMCVWLGRLTCTCTENMVRISSS